MTYLTWINFSLCGDNCTFTTCILGVIILYTIYWSLRKNNSFTPLPGPTGLPLVGYFPFLRSDPLTALANLAKKYGPAYQIQLGSKPCLVLCGYEAIREAIIKQSDVYSGRPKLSISVYKTETAIVFDEGPTYSDVRHFIFDALKQLGFGRSSMEPVVKVRNYDMLEVQDLIAELKQFNSEPKEVAYIFQRSIGKAICSILTGNRNSLDDQWLRRLILAVNGIRETSTHDQSYFFPWLKKLPFCGKFTNDSEKRYFKDEIWRAWQEKIDEVKKGMAEGKAFDSFITAWFKEADQRERTNDPHKHLYSEFSLRSNIDLLTEASIETTSTTIIWGLQYLINHPEVQDKIYAEITKLLADKEFDLSFVEAKEMPYTRAVIQEIHRMASTLPLGLFHRTTAESVLMGYKVPKGILVLICQYAVHYDPDNFSSPSQFKPYRFLTEEGEFIKNEKVIPFGVAKRSCPGELVAQMEIFHYLTAIVHEFILELGPNNKDYGLANNKSVVRFPAPFTIRFKPRHK